MDSVLQGLKLQVPHPPVQAPARLVGAVLVTPPGGVTLLVAATGYGRTTLAVHATAASEEPVAWVSGDAMDATPGRLLTHIEAATAAVLDGTPPTGGELDDTARWDALLDRWAAAPPSWLVLDDVHHATDPGTVAGLAYLAARLPATVRLLLTSRADLPALTADLRTSERLSVLDESSLALTEVETVEALTGTGLGAGQPETLRVARLCAGWPAAVSVVGRRTGSTHDLATWLAGPGAERLLSDWWQQLPPDGRDLLRATLHLPRLHPELCDLTLARDGSSEVLFALVSAHAHLRPAPLGDVMGWARHPLLTELLRHRAGALTVPVDRLRAAAVWARQHGDVDTEVRLLVAAEEIEEATSLVRRHEEPFIQQRRTAEVLDWYRLLPPDAVTERAGLLLRHAWAALIGGDVDRARMLHGSLGATLAHDHVEPEVSELRGDEALLAAQLAMCDAEPETMLTHLRRAELAFGDAWDRPVHQAVPVLRARALLWLGRHEQAGAVLREVRRRGPSAPVVGDTAVPAVESALALAEGRVREAHAMATRALSAADADPGPIQSLGVVPARLCLGGSATDLGDFEAAQLSLNDAVAAARHEGLLGFEVLGLAATARLECYRGDPLRSVETLRVARAALAARSPLSFLVHHLDSVEAMARISLGDAARAGRLIAQLPPGPATTLLAVRLAQLRRPGSGTSRLERLVAVQGRDRADRELLMASALATTQRTRATRHLLDAADLADSCGLMTLLVGSSDAVLDLAREEARRSADDHLARLLAIADRSPAPTRTGPHLSTGERELLALLPTRDSNDAVATRLGISVNTVKTRLRRLYTKLDVGRRDDAVRVARERGLIE